MSTLFPYTTLFRSSCQSPRPWRRVPQAWLHGWPAHGRSVPWPAPRSWLGPRRVSPGAPRAAPVPRGSTGRWRGPPDRPPRPWRSEEHTSELQSRRCLRSSPTRRSSDLPASRGGPGGACRKPGFMVGLLTVEAFLGPRLDLGSGLGEFRQALLAPRQFLGDRQAVGEVRLIGRLGLGDRKSTRLNSSHADVYALPLHDALPIFLPVAAALAARAASLASWLACSRSKRSLARASILARASASFARRSSRRASSSGIDRPLGRSA